MRPSASIAHPVLAAIAVAAATTLGCVTEPEPEPGTTAAPLIEDCPRLFCGNTPYLGAYPFWELDETGASFSKNGLRIAGATFGGVPQKIDVEGFKWIRTPLGGGASQPINGTVIKLEAQDATVSYELSIAAAPSVPYYENGNDGTLIPTYWVTYTTVSNGRRRPPVNLCGADQGSSLPRPAIVFQGDRYSSETGALVATGAAARPWFNITCKEDALWKLALMRHVDAAQDAAHPTTVGQRMALLRSIRADYCGDGTPLTELGTAVDWLNVGGWLTKDAPGSVEAIWGPDGAVCVDQPRLPVVIDCASPTPEPPTCDEFLGDWTSAGSVLTIVP